MRALTFAAGLVLALPAVADDIPSTVTGDYVGGGWNCRVIAYESSAVTNTIELQCTGPDNRPRITAVTWGGCPQTGSQSYTLYPWPGVATGTPVLRIDSVGDQQIGTTIDGLPVYLALSQPLPSPSPYPGCGYIGVQPQPHIARICRQFGLFCG